MTGFGLGAVTGMKEVTPYQAVRWDFENFLVPFGILEMIVVDADDFFLGCSRIISSRTY